MRRIKITDTLKEDVLQAFQKYLNTTRLSQNKINFNLDITDVNEDLPRPQVIFTKEAYIKMNTLIEENTTEVGWHGTVIREGNTFTIMDILVYPQQVTGATVTTDEVEYGNWLHLQLLDEQINTLRFHGHSHVNFGVTPSGVDTTWYDQLLQTLSDEDYYITLIKNKKGDVFIELYDLKTNIIYETKDIDIIVQLETESLDDWYNTQMMNVTTYSYKPKYTSKDLMFPESYIDRLEKAAKHKPKKSIDRWENLFND